jgi:hypothetical protein
MKFAFAWTFAGEPGDETLAPPHGKRAPASPRPVPPSGQVHLPNWPAHPPRHACGLPHRMPPAFCVWGTCHWPRSRLRRPAKTAQPPAVRPAPVAQGTSWKHVSGRAYRTVRAGLLAKAGLGRLTPTGLLLLVGGLQKLVSRTVDCSPTRPKVSGAERWILSPGAKQSSGSGIASIIQPAPRKAASWPSRPYRWRRQNQGNRRSRTLPPWSAAENSDCRARHPRRALGRDW